MLNGIITRRNFLRATATASGLGIGVGMYTWRWEPTWLELVERRLPVAHLPPALDGARLVQISDLHIGPQVDDSYLLQTFERVKAIDSEIVVYTGDFTTYAGDVIAHAKRVFAHLPVGRLGAFGVLGNHDYGPGWNRLEVADQIASLADSVGVQILRNQVAEVEGLQIVGLDDLWAGHFRPNAAFTQLDPQRAALVLSHNPDTVDEPGWDSYRGWILSGHTHGGQCKPPFLPPPLLPVRNRRYTSGEFLLPGQRRIYISRGVGHLLRVRFNVRPEVTVFQLESA